MTVRWRKVLRDVFGYKTRTVLGRAVDCGRCGRDWDGHRFACGDVGRICPPPMPRSTRCTPNWCSRILTRNWLTRSPVCPKWPMPKGGVAKGYRSWLVRTSGKTCRSPPLMIVSDQHAAQQSLLPERSMATPQTGELLIERSSLSLLNVQAGDTVIRQTARRTNALRPVRRRHRPRSHPDLRPVYRRSQWLYHPRYAGVAGRRRH